MTSMESPEEHGGHKTTLNNIMVELIPGKEHYCRVIPVDEFVDHHFKGIPRESVTKLVHVIEF
jgi:hypothetical protein